MGRVAVTYRVLPEGAEVDMGDLVRRVEDSYGDAVASSEVKPFAFGLQALEVVLVMDDAEGEAEAREGALKALPGVQSVEVLHLSLL